MKVLSLNCWGLPWTSDFKTRMEHILDALIDSNYDIIILQEIFLSNDIENYKNSLTHIYPYIHYFYSGFIGSGIMFISKYKIIDPISIPYHQSGLIYETGGDWFARKSICYAKIIHPQKIVHLFGTHTHAKYIGNDHLALRTLQLYYLARVISHFTHIDDTIIVAGDLNTEPHEIGIKYLLDKCKLVDPYYNFYDDSSHLFTCNDRNNKYCCSRDQPYRIDYILHSRNITSISYNIVFKDIPSKKICYSDHYGVETILDFTSDTLYSKLDEKLTLDNIQMVKKCIFNGMDNSNYSLTSNLIVLLMVCATFELIYVFLSGLNWKLVNSCTITICVVLIWAFFNSVQYISLRSQKRTYKAVIEELSNEINQLSK